MHDRIGTLDPLVYARIGPSVGMPVPSITTASTDFQIDARQSVFGTRRWKIIDRVKLARRVERAGNRGNLKAVRAPIGNAGLGQVGRIGRYQPNPLRTETPQRLGDGLACCHEGDSARVFDRLDGGLLALDALQIGRAGTGKCHSPYRRVGELRDRILHCGEIVIRTGH